MAKAENLIDRFMVLSLPDPTGLAPSIRLSRAIRDSRAYAIRPFTLLQEYVALQSAIVVNANGLLIPTFQERQITGFLSAAAQKVSPETSRGVTHALRGLPRVQRIRWTSDHRW